MELNLNSWHCKFYCWSHLIKNKATLPKSLCQYFWGFLFALLLSPITFPTWLIKPHRYVDNSLFLRAIFGVVLWANFCLGIVILYVVCLHVIAVLVTFAIGIILCGLFWAIWNLMIFLHSPSKKKNETFRVIYEGINSTIKKYCPIIKWVGDEKI